MKMYFVAIGLVVAVLAAAMFLGGGQGVPSGPPVPLPVVSSNGSPLEFVGGPDRSEPVADGATGEPTWFRHVENGVVVYEGPVPVDKLPHPPLIERQKRQDPTDAELAAVVRSWGSSFVLYAISHEQLRTPDEQKSTAGATHMASPEGRFIQSVRATGPRGRPLKSEEEEMVLRVLELEATRALMEHHCTLEYADPDMKRRMRLTIPYQEVESESLDVSHILASEHGVFVSLSIDAISPYTYFDLIGGAE